MCVCSPFHQTHLKFVNWLNITLTSMCPPKHVWLAISWSCIKPWTVCWAEYYAFVNLSCIRVPTLFVSNCHRWTPCRKHCQFVLSNQRATAHSPAEFIELIKPSVCLVPLSAMALQGGARVIKCVQVVFMSPLSSLSQDANQGCPGCKGVISVDFHLGSRPSAVWSSMSLISFLLIPSAELPDTWAWSMWPGDTETDHV